METYTKPRCPRCQMARLRAWHELHDEEQELARRLPQSAEMSLEQRRSGHLWCRRCWYETPDAGQQI